MIRHLPSAEELVAGIKGSWNLEPNNCLQISKEQTLGGLDSGQEFLGYWNLIFLEWVYQNLGLDYV